MVSCLVASRRSQCDFFGCVCVTSFLLLVFLSWLGGLFASWIVFDFSLSFCFIPLIFSHLFLLVSFLVITFSQLKKA